MDRPENIGNISKTEPQDGDRVPTTVGNKPPGNVGRHGLCRLPKDKEIHKRRNSPDGKPYDKIVERDTEGNIVVIGGS